ncbi:Miniconductance mechanosensitive channel MscM precursor [Planctomycetes bacterium Poly30]|uniref:Miniconductance mechanosensitive channel MscM n=1 Tax=Saltatorellus ferox TaxID=2528018 RepID=A0A518F169_9BACT|nr:Miniconductance mechanosensitive channel MscM precursor [Planctomycetes bacterium Poly30]
MSRSLAVLASAGFLLFAWFGPLGTTFAWAATQDGDPVTVPAASDRLDRQEIAAELKDLEALDPADASDASKALVDIYKDTLQSLDAREAAQSRAKELEALAAGATEARAAIEAELDQPSEPVIPSTEGLALTDHEAMKVEAELAADDARRALTVLEAELDVAQDRRATITEELSALTARRAELETELGTESTGAVDERVGTALRLRQTAELQATVARIEELRVEEATFDLRKQLLQSRLELARRTAAEKSTVLSVLESSLNAARQRDAQRKAQEAIQQAEAAAMQGEPFASLGAELVKSRAVTLELAGELEVDRKRIDELEDQKKDLGKRFEKTQRRIKIAGLSKDTGLHLRRERIRLLDRRTTRAQIAEDRERLTEIELARFEVESREREIIDDDRFVEDLVEAASASGQTGEQITQLAKRLKQDLLSALRAETAMLGDRSGQLLTITQLHTSTIESHQVYEDYVAERILWIRSSEPLWKVKEVDMLEEFRRLPALTKLPSVPAWFAAEMRRRPLVMVLLAVALSLLLAARLRVKRALAEEGELARQRSQVSILPTLRATGYSMIVAAPYAAVLYGLSWLTATSNTDGEIMRALSVACARAAAAALIIGALRALTAKDGLEEAHFDAQSEAVRLVRRQTNWLLPVMPTAALLGEFMASLDAGSTADALARVAFLVEVGSLLLFTWRVLNPRRGVLALNARSAGPEDLLTRLRRLWFLLAVIGLGMLALLAVVGYGFTARSLFGKVEITVGLVLALVTVRSIALRWIKLIRRREALEKLRKKREELRAKRLAEIERRRSAGEDTAELESEGLEVEQEEVNLASISSDLKSLIRMATVAIAVGGAYWIWSSVLPALGAFERVELWQQQVAKTDTVTGSIAYTYAPVTLANVGLALILLIVTWRAVSDLPSLLEIILLRRLDLGSGERYAITTLLRYFLTTVGVLLAFDKLGLAWSQLQWLVAGISVGLGFGLQEIFANFVSGITLLFERPVRVGDWVTLGDIEGVVSKIRIRATTIRDRDLKELIVPNREFITGRFINWTLSDPVSRVTAQVGIAYGSDTEKAIQLLLEAGRDCPYSVAEPAPNVVFMSFGASSLDFELRVFVTGREIKPRVLHDLHMRIDAAFRTAEIEISFPQRDLHIRSAPGLEGLVRDRS